MLRAASSANMPILPLLLDMDSYTGAYNTVSHPQKWHLKAILNRCNRVPANRSYQPGDFTWLLRALESMLALPRTSEALLSKRIPKLAGLLNALPCVLPEDGGAFESKYDANLSELLKRIGTKSNSDARLAPHSDTMPAVAGESGEVILSYTPDPAVLGLVDRLVTDLQSRGVEVVHMDLHNKDMTGSAAWYQSCEQARVCVPLLSKSYAECSEAESQITFAKDNNKEIVPLVASEDWYEHMPSKWENSRGDMKAKVHSMVQFQRLAEHSLAGNI
jgi:hypothetical protein